MYHICHFTPPAILKQFQLSFPFTARQTPTSHIFQQFFTLIFTLLPRTAKCKKSVLVSSDCCVSFACLQHGYLAATLLQSKRTRGAAATLAKKEIYDAASSKVTL